jgi:hypothetical protein
MSDSQEHYLVVRNALDEQNPDKYTHLLRSGIGSAAQWSITTALQELGVKHRYSVSVQDIAIWTTPDDAERAEWIAHRVEERSKTWEFVQRFATVMEHKFSLNRHKGDRDGWLVMSPNEIMLKLRAEMCELEAAYHEWYLNSTVEAARAVLLEAADVGNFCVELTDKIGAL